MMKFTAYDGKVFEVKETEVCTKGAFLKRLLNVPGEIYAVRMARRRGDKLFDKRMKILLLGDDGNLYEYSGPERTGDSLLSGFAYHEKNPGKYVQHG